METASQAIGEAVEEGEERATATVAPEITEGLDSLLPVDLYIPGCPPRPEALIHGIVTLHEKVKTEKLSQWS